MDRILHFNYFKERLITISDELYECTRYAGNFDSYDDNPILSHYMETDDERDARITREIEESQMEDDWYLR